MKQKKRIDKLEKHIKKYAEKNGMVVKHVVRRNAVYNDYEDGYSMNILVKTIPKKKKN